MILTLDKKPNNLLCQRSMYNVNKYSIPMAKLFRAVSMQTPLVES